MAPFPDAFGNNPMVMDFEEQMPALSSEDEFETTGSASEVEVSIESDRAMTDDDDSSAFGHGDDDDDSSSTSSEETFETFEGGYTELVETGGEGEPSESHHDADEPPEEIPEPLDQQQQQQQHHPEQGVSPRNSPHRSPKNSPNRVPKKPSRSPQTPRRNSASFFSSDDFDDTGRNRRYEALTSPKQETINAFGENEGFDVDDDNTHRNRKFHSVETLRTESTAPTEPIDFSSSNRSPTKPNSFSSHKRTTSAPMPNENPLPSPSLKKPSSFSSHKRGSTNNLSHSEKPNSYSSHNRKDNNNNFDNGSNHNDVSIKVPARHSNKHEGGGNYYANKLEENNGHQRNRSRSNSRKQQQQQQDARNHSRKGRSRSRKDASAKSEEFSEHSEHSHRGGGGGNSNSHHPRSSSHDPSHHGDTPAPRRLSSIHTSTPSDPRAAEKSTHSAGGGSHARGRVSTNVDGTKRVSWKSDPKASFSDWTLHVLYRDKATNKRRYDVYHLHRNVVGFGHRKSNFLLRDIMEVELQDLIASGRKMEAELKQLIYTNNTPKKANPGPSKKKDTIITRLKLHSESQARAVPLVLDFMYYTNETKQKMSAERSCNIFKVAELLEVRALEKAIGDFYMKNLTLKNLGEFLSAATKARAEKLLTICKAKIGQMITAKPELSAKVPPKFMADILSVSGKQLVEAQAREPEKYTSELIISQSKYWSKAACICAAKNEGKLTAKLFQKLTSEQSLPYIDVSATPKLLSLESKFLGGSDNKGSRSRENELTSLQRRCVESIGNDFSAFQECFDSHQQIAESLKHLPSSILSEILMKLLTRP